MPSDRISLEDSGFKPGILALMSNFLNNEYEKPHGIESTGRPTYTDIMVERGGFEAMIKGSNLDKWKNCVFLINRNGDVLRRVFEILLDF